MYYPYYSQAPGGDQDTLASLLEACDVISLYIESIYKPS